MGGQRAAGGMECAAGLDADACFRPGRQQRRQPGETKPEN